MKIALHAGSCCWRQPLSRDRCCCTANFIRTIQARQSPADEPERRLSNPFRRKDAKAEAAARKSLEGMFKGHKDILSSNDPDLGSGGGSRGGRRERGGSGGGGGGWQPPAWRDWGDGFNRRLGSGLRALAAVLLFVAAFLVVPLIPQLIVFLVTLLKVVLRLDGRAVSAPRHRSTNSAELAGTTDLGLSEASVISKYGGAEDTFEEGDHDD